MENEGYSQHYNQIFQIFTSLEHTTLIRESNCIANMVFWKKRGIYMATFLRMVWAANSIKPKAKCTWMFKRWNISHLVYQIKPVLVVWPSLLGMELLPLVGTHLSQKYLPHRLVCYIIKAQFLNIAFHKWNIIRLQEESQSWNKSACTFRVSFTDLRPSGRDNITQSLDNRHATGTFYSTNDWIKKI